MDSNATKTLSSRWLIGAAVAVAVLAVVSVVVVLATGDNDETQPAGSPEAAVQDFLQAMQGGEYETAYAYLSPELQEDCTLTEFRRSSRFTEDSTQRVLLESTREVTDGVEVRVSIVSPPRGTVFQEEYSYTRVLLLQQIDGQQTGGQQTGGAWRFVDPPWPVEGCGRLPQRVPAEAPQRTPAQTPATATPTPSPVAPQSAV